MTNGASEYDPKTDGIKVAAVKWLWSQGVSTVLLLLLVYGLWEIVPQLVDKVTASYERIEANHRVHIDDLVSRFSADRKDDRELIRELKMERRSRSGSPRVEPVE